MTDAEMLLEKVKVFIASHRGMTPTSFAKLADAPDCVRNLERYVDGRIKSGGWNLETIAKVAKAMGTTSWELLRPPGAVPKDAEFKEYIRQVVDEQLALPGAEPAPPKRSGRR